MTLFITSMLLAHTVHLRCACYKPTLWLTAKSRCAHLVCLYYITSIDNRTTIFDDVTNNEVNGGLYALFALLAMAMVNLTQNKGNTQFFCFVCIMNAECSVLINE